MLLCLNSSYIPTGVYPFLLVVSFMHILLKILDWLIPRSVSNIKYSLIVQYFYKKILFSGNRLS